MSLRPFPLLDLDPNPLQRILELMDSYEIIDLSLCSKRAKRAVKQVTVLQPISRLEMFFPVWVNLSSGGWGRSWRFKDRREVNPMKLVPSKSRVINGVEFVHFVDGIMEGYTSDSHESQILHFCEYVKDVFSCSMALSRLEIVSFMALPGSLLLLGQWDYLRSFETVQVHHDAVSHEELAAILEHFSPPLFKFTCSPGKAFRYEKKISARALQINNAFWIKGVNLLNLNCDQVIMFNAVVSNEDVNAFIKNWLNGTDHKLQFLRLVLDSPRKFDLEELLKDIPTTPGTLKQLEDSTYPTNQMDSGANISQNDIRNGLDVRRKSDQRLATIITNKEQDEFLFIVWQTLEPFVRVNIDSLSLFSLSSNE